MDHNQETPAHIRLDWQEAWAPAFHRVLFSIKTVDKLMRQAPADARDERGVDVRL
jgi:hypothetical protein